MDRTVAKDGIVAGIAREAGYVGIFKGGILAGIDAIHRVTICHGQTCARSGVQLADGRIVGKDVFSKAAARKLSPPETDPLR